MSNVQRNRTSKIKEVIEYTNSDMELLINEHIHSERDRQILKRRLIDGICYEPLAEEFDLSVSQVKRIVHRCENIVFKYIT